MNTSHSPLFLTAIALAIFSVTALRADTMPVAKDPAAYQSAALPSSSLDGKTFVAQTGEKGKRAKGSDTIVFRDGRFLSEGCNKSGFTDAPYQTTIDGDAFRFHAETHSPTHGSMVWDGIVRGDTIEATSIWTRKRWYWNIKKEFWFRGQLKK